MGQPTRCLIYFTFSKESDRRKRESRNEPRNVQAAPPSACTLRPPPRLSTTRNGQRADSFDSCRIVSTPAHNLALKLAPRPILLTCPPSLMESELTKTCFVSLMTILCLTRYCDTDLVPCLWRNVRMGVINAQRRVRVSLCSNFGKMGSYPSEAVSYTHLTLPTILLV